MKIGVILEGDSYCLQPVDDDDLYLAADGKLGPRGTAIIFNPDRDGHKEAVNAAEGFGYVVST